MFIYDEGDVKLISFNYRYKLEKGGKKHPCPEIMPEPIKNTEDFYIIHYGKLDPRYI